ncbi:MAG TPA: hypothetical protein VK762_05505 [Polyangiaceae bacterium]|nr:hypothetical protein [Polyangiaceae bacterium]
MGRPNRLIGTSFDQVERSVPLLAWRLRFIQEGISDLSAGAALSGRRLARKDS